MCSKKTAVIVSTAVFVAVAVMHFVRYFLQTKVIVGTFTVPVSWSLYIGVLLVALVVWLITSLRK